MSENDPFLEDSEDGYDWEEVEVPEQQPQQQSLEITISTTQSRPKKEAGGSGKFKGISHEERLRRIDCHKIHTVALLVNARARNQWINDPLLHGRLLSVTPISLQNAFAVIHKSRVPDQNQRGRMFEAAITKLVDWWSSTYFEVNYEGHIRSRTYDDIQARLTKLGTRSTDSDTPLDIEEIEEVMDEDFEPIRSPKSLMKHVLMRNGSRDTSAQLFTSLCRALSIPSRLVVSLQSVPWQAHVGKPKPRYAKKSKGKGKAAEESHEYEHDGQQDQEDLHSTPSGSRSGSQTPAKGRDGIDLLGRGRRNDGGLVQKSEKAKGKEKANPDIKLRKPKSKGRVSSVRSHSGSNAIKPDPTTTPPVFWTEVFSRPDARWIPVDPIRSIVNKRKVFDPTPTTSSSTPAPISTPFQQTHNAPLNKRVLTANTDRYLPQENRLMYVLAFEEDGYARDVTRRYAKEFNAKIAKVQGGSRTSGGAARQMWWDQVVGLVSRPYRLNRDDIEDEELEAAQMMEGMPTTMAGFKDHPTYVLTRHLRQNQVIYPPPPDTPELGKFRGEPVYSRSAVVSLKTAENWLRSEGRTVKEGSQPLKMVKTRAGTINKIRELEVLKDELRDAGDNSPGDSMQGLYARDQTEPYKPEPVIDGIIPKNNFGNIDLYVPSMLPHGAVHVPFKGVARLAKKLGFDFAEAVTGFEFRKRRAIPVVEGVVVAKENEVVLLEAYWEAEQDAAEKARLKRDERVIKHWTKLIQGLRIRQRLQTQYATKAHTQQPSHEDNPNSTNSKSDTDVDQLGNSKDLLVTMSHPDSILGGGFLVGADDVVEPFNLPKYKYQQLADSALTLSTSSAPLPSIDGAMSSEPAAESNEPPQRGGISYELETLDIDPDEEIEEPGTLPSLHIGDSDRPTGPKTMRELAEAAATQHHCEDGDSENDVNEKMESDTNHPFPADDHVAHPRLKIVPHTSAADLKTLRNTTSTSVPMINTGEESVRPTPRRTSARTRARKRIRDDDVDSDKSAPEDPLPSTSKKRRSAKVPAVAAVPSRTLRPRARKSYAETQELDEESD